MIKYICKVVKCLATSTVKGGDKVDNKPVKRGRPKGIKTGLKRPIAMTIQVTSEERSLIKGNAHDRGLSVTNYILQLIQENKK